MKNQIPPPNYSQEQNNIQPTSAPYLDPTANLRGWPGYRTQTGKSGYDPLDTDFEAAHISGVLIRSLFTLRFRTRNLLYLILSGLCAVLAALPLIFGVGIISGGNLGGGLLFLVVTAPIWFCSLLIVVNIVLSLFFRDPDAPAEGDVWV
jgi:hypothetical protein